jgi:hypothetical protein
LIADRTIILGWTASTDDVLVGRYDVYRDGNVIGWTCEPFYRDTNLTQQTTYSYAVQAVDWCGKTSDLSQALGVTTLGPPTLGTGTGLLGKYYDEMNFSQRKVVRTDATVNFDWGWGSPDAAIGPDTFSVRWEGWIEPLYSEEYTFYTVSDDGIRVWVDGQIVVNNWTDHAPTEDRGWAPLKAGQRYEIRVDFYENGGGAVAKLLWESPSQPKEIVPQTQLYPAEFVDGTAVRLLTPLESKVSPAWVEGQVSEGAASVQFTVNGGVAVDAVRESATQWFADTASSSGAPYGIPLYGDAPAALAVTVTDSLGASETHDYQLSWAPTVLNGMDAVSDEIVIRKGDSLLFVVEEDEPGGSEVVIDADGDGNADISGVSNQKFPHQYAQAGHFTVTAWLGGQVCGTLNVTVVNVDLDGPIACEVGFKRKKGVLMVRTNHEVS